MRHSLYTFRLILSCTVHIFQPLKVTFPRFFNTDCLSLTCLYSSKLGVKEVRNCTFSRKLARSASLAFTRSNLEVASARDCCAWLYKAHSFRNVLNCSTTITALSRSITRASRCTLYVSKRSSLHVQWLVLVYLRHVEWIAAMHSVLLHFLQSLLLRHHKQLLGIL